MVNILCVCGNGMGTSTILKISVRKICSVNDIDASVESCSFGEAMSFLPSTDIVITSPEWASTLPSGGKAKIITVQNLVDSKAVEAALVAEVRKDFPASMGA